MYYDCHTHTYFSHDASSEKSPEASCRYAYSNGLYGLTFSEHVDLRYNERNGCIDNVKEEYKAVSRLKEEYCGKMKVLMGAEISDAPYCPHELKAALEVCDYDVLLCSVHLLEFNGKVLEPAITDFSKTPMDDIRSMIQLYLDDVKKSLCAFKSDILCHFTYPLRYFNDKYGKGASFEEFYPTIEEIFKIAIENHMALEINTSKVSPDNLNFCPDESFVKLYSSLGGTLFTLGSDSHTVGTEANCFNLACDMLKDAGITQCCYFENRKPVFYTI